MPLHPQEAHWHLSLIGVDPPYQGKGIDSDLLSHIFNVCDGQKVFSSVQVDSHR
jgi:ribosomal protein S18 acetylase RimI-like enzyme